MSEYILCACSVYEYNIFQCVVCDCILLRCVSGDIDIVSVQVDNASPAE